MLWLFLHLHVLTVLGDAAPPSQPQSVLADHWNLTWRPAPGEDDLNFTVYYHSFKGPSDDDKWEVVPTCNQAPSLWCDVSFTKPLAKHGCVKLRVQAQRHKLTSDPGQACSVHGDSCTPEVRLSARPGSLTVHLTGDHSLFQEYAAHSTHWVYFGQEGQPLQDYISSASSWTKDGLEEGRRYCARVEYVIFNKSVGLSSCVQCELIPSRVSHTATVVVAVVLVVLLLLVVPVTAYVLIFHRGHVKHCLKPPCEIPEGFLQSMQPDGPLLVFSPSEEHCTRVSSVLPVEEWSTEDFSVSVH